MDDQNRARRVFGAPRAHRAQQKAGESTEPATADDQHLGVLAAFGEDLRRVALLGRQVQADRAIGAVHLVNSCDEVLLGVGLRIPDISRVHANQPYITG
jgi:hypothetical protein